MDTRLSSSRQQAYRHYFSCLRRRDGNVDFLLAANRGYIFFFLITSCLFSWFDLLLVQSYGLLYPV